MRATMMEVSKGTTVAASRWLAHRQLCAVFSAHPFQVLYHQLSVTDEGSASWSRTNAPAMAFEERCSEALFHQPNSFAGRCQRHTGPHGAMRDA